MTAEPRMPEILTLRCAVCGRLLPIRGAAARRIRDRRRAEAEVGGLAESCEFGDTITIDACSDPACVRKAIGLEGGV